MNSCDGLTSKSFNVLITCSLSSLKYTTHYFTPFIAFLPLSFNQPFEMHFSFLHSLDNKGSADLYMYQYMDKQIFHSTGTSGLVPSVPFINIVSKSGQFFFILKSIILDNSGTYKNELF